MIALLKKHQSIFLSLGKILGGSLLLTLSAHIKAVLPFSLVPVTGQTLALAFLALTLNRKEALLTVLTYLAQGFAGLPVFALLSGPVVLLSPSAGYLYGMVPAALLMSFCAEKGCLSSPLKTAGAVVAGFGIIYAFGLAWLSFFLPASTLLSSGILPFLPGDGAKVSALLVLLPLIRSLRR